MSEGRGDAPIVSVRGIELGGGLPEIIVPLTGADPETVLLQARDATTTPARLVEWRLDLFGPVLDAAAHRAAVLELLPALRDALGQEHALLVTLRTGAEGGARTISDQNLSDVLVAVVRTAPLIDLIDVETSRSPQAVQRVVDVAREHGVAVVGSFHDFVRTPARDVLVEVLRAQRRLGADVPKIAVTPQAACDVLTLLSASLTVAADGQGPHIAISMGSLGAVSRVAAETFGSAATFATSGESSAPGQLDAADVACVLELLRP